MDEHLSKEMIGSQAASLIMDLYLKIRLHEPQLPPKQALIKAKHHITNELPYDDETVDAEFEEVRSEGEKLRYKEILLAVGASITANAIYDALLELLKNLHMIPMKGVFSNSSVITEYGISYDTSDGAANYQAENLIKFRRLLKDLPLILMDFDNSELLERYDYHVSQMHEYAIVSRKVLEDLINGDEIELPISPFYN